MKVELSEVEAFILRLIGCEMCEGYAAGDADCRPHKVVGPDGGGPDGTPRPAVWHGFGEECGECDWDDRVLEAERLGLIAALDVWHPRTCVCGEVHYAHPTARYECAMCGAESAPEAGRADS